MQLFYKETKLFDFCKLKSFFIVAAIFPSLAGKWYNVTTS